MVLGCGLHLPVLYVAHSGYLPLFLCPLSSVSVFIELLFSISSFFHFSDILHILSYSDLPAQRRGPSIELRGPTDFKGSGWNGPGSLDDCMEQSLSHLHATVYLQWTVM